MPLTTKQVVLLTKKHHLMPAAYNVAKIARICEIGGLKARTPMQVLRQFKNEDELVNFLQLLTTTSLKKKATGEEIRFIIDSIKR